MVVSGNYSRNHASVFTDFTSYFLSIFLERIVNLLLFQKRVFSFSLPFEFLVEIKLKYYDIEYHENNRDKFIPR